MIRRRMAVAAAVVGLGLGTLGVGGAQAQGNGVGRNDGTTGKARACQAHAENKGKSVAKGLECAPAATLVVRCADAATVTHQVIGSGPMPFSEVRVTSSSEGIDYRIGIVDGSGNLSEAERFLFGDTVNAITASGGAITATIPPECRTAPF